VNWQLGNRFVNLVGPTLYLALILDIIPFLYGDVDVLCPCTRNPVNGADQMGFYLAAAYTMLTFMANQHLELGVDAKKFVGLVFPVHPERGNVYVRMNVIWALGIVTFLTCTTGVYGVENKMGSSC
jgi:hypothetical protein